MLAHTGVSSQTTPPPKQRADHYGGSDVDVAFVIKLTTARGTIVAGYNDSLNGDTDPQTSSEYWDPWVANLDKRGTLQRQQLFGGTGYESARDIVQTLIQQIDSMGRVVKVLTNHEYVTGTYNIDIYKDGLASGIYFTRLQNKSLQQVIKVVKMPL